MEIDISYSGKMERSDDRCGWAKRERERLGERRERMRVKERKIARDWSKTGARRQEQEQQRRSRNKSEEEWRVGGWGGEGRMSNAWWWRIWGPSQLGTKVPGNMSNWRGWSISLLFLFLLLLSWKRQCSLRRSWLNINKCYCKYWDTTKERVGSGSIQWWMADKQTNVNDAR